MGLRFYNHGLALWVVLLAGNLALAQTDWPQLQRDSMHSGYSPDSVGLPANGISVVKWRWHPDRQTSLAGRVQPVIKNNVLCVGFYNGRMYGLNAKTGTLSWSFQAGGPILHTAAMDSSKVYFGCYDGKVYALNLTTGALAWMVDTGKPIQTAPCLAGSMLYIGNEDGKLFGIRTTGQIAWTYDSGRPILTTAAVSGGKVYCGNEGVYAFALDAVSGQQLWKVRLKGQSMAGYWPVVMDSQNVVFFRTEPVNVFHQALGNGDTTLGGGGYNSLDGAPSDFTTEYANIRTFLSATKDEQSFWALNTTNGTEKYVAPVLYTAGEGTCPVPPIFDPATGRAWYVCRSKYARWDSGSQVRAFGNEPAKFDAATGNYTLFATNATKGYAGGGPGDESSILSADAYGVLYAWRGTLTYIRHSTEAMAHVISSVPSAQDDYAHAADSPLAYTSASGFAPLSVQAGGGDGGGQVAAAAVAQNAIFWVARWGLLVRVEKQ